MFAIFATLAILATAEAPSATINPVERVQVLARVVRGAEASKRRSASHNPDRVRTIVEKLPDGRKVDLIVLDFE